MQTIKISTKQTGSNLLFMIDGVCVAHVGKDFRNPGQYRGRINRGGGAVCDNHTFADAVKFISDALCKLFADFGLNIEFVNA